MASVTLSTKVQSKFFAKFILGLRCMTSLCLFHIQTQTVNNQLAEIKDLKIQIISLEEDKTIVERQLYDYENSKTRVLINVVYLCYTKIFLVKF